MFCVTGQDCQNFDNPDYLFSFQHFQPLQVLFLLFLLFPACSPRYPWGWLNSTGCYSFASRAIPVLNSSGLGDSCDFMPLALVIRGLLSCRTSGDTMRLFQRIAPVAFGIAPRPLNAATPATSATRLLYPLVSVASLGSTPY